MSHLLSFASRRTYTSHPNRTHLSSKQQPLFHRDLLRRSHFQCDRGKSSAYLPYSHPTQFPPSSPSPPPRIQLHTDHRTKLFRVTRTSHIRRSGGEQRKHACVRACDGARKKKEKHPSNSEEVDNDNNRRNEMARRTNLPIHPDRRACRMPIAAAR